MQHYVYINALRLCKQPASKALLYKPLLFVN